MRLRFVFSFCLFCCVLCAATPARAVLLPGYSAGTGANTASLVIDFEFIGGDAYLFEYRFDGSATAQDMLLALDAAGGLTVHHQFFDFGDGPTIFVNGFSYAGNSAVPGFEGEAGENWAYWVRDETPGSFTYWTTPVVGATDRVLVDGSVDGWSLNVSAFNSKELPATYLPPAEPSLLVIPGDPDFDGDIDDADLGIAFANYTGPVGSFGGKTASQGDTDDDGDIDDADLGTLYSNYSGPLSPASVPEPASVLILAFGVVSLAKRRH